MKRLDKNYPYEKALVMNTVYDALEATGFQIDKVNSSRGSLTVFCKDNFTLGGKIEVLPDISGNATLIEIIPKSEENEQSEWVNAFFDEVSSIITRAFKSKEDIL